MDALIIPADDGGPDIEVPTANGFVQRCVSAIAAVNIPDALRAAEILNAAAADALIAQGDTGTAYALHELANNLLTVMQGKASLEAWNGCYTADGCEQLDLDKHMPAPADDAFDLEATVAALEDRGFAGEARS